MDRQNGRGYNRGYGLDPSYGNQDTRGSRESSGEPRGRMNGALEHEGRPPFRYNSRSNTPQRRDSDCPNPPTDRKSEPSTGPSTTMGPTLPSAQPTAPHPKAGEAWH